MKKLFIYLILLISISLYFGCSELEKDITEPTDVSVHGKEVLKPDSENFHGKLVKNNKWDMNLCKSCHGINYDGGITGVSCRTCHTEPTGPENCATCHGSSTSPAPPRDLSNNTSKLERGVGAHQVHLAGNSKGRVVICSECHSVPGSLYQQGHVDTDTPAEVLMNNSLANLVTNDPTTSHYTFQLPIVNPDPLYNLASASCSNTYCHGTFKNGNTDNAPVWAEPNTSACGTCHGDPSRSTPEERALPKTSAEGGTHPNFITCSSCHGGVVNANLQIINASKHIDGKLNLFGDDIRY
jgi:predicted CxxxxCH...CXXCH cytochrome family protein